MFYFKRLFLLFVILGSFFILQKALQAESAEHLVISEIKTQGASANDEFIELYNPTDEDISLAEWSIQYKSATGSTYYKKNFSLDHFVAAHSFFLVAHNDYEGGALADLSHNSFSMSSAGGHLYLVNNQSTLTNSYEESIVDKVAYGTGDSAEGKAALAPNESESLERKASENSTAETLASGREEEFNGNGYDSNDNSFDFIIQANPHPQNSESTIESLVTEITEDEVTDDEEQDESDDETETTGGTEDTENSEDETIDDQENDEGEKNETKDDDTSDDQNDKIIDDQEEVDEDEENELDDQQEEEIIDDDLADDQQEEEIIDDDLADDQEENFPIDEEEEIPEENEEEEIIEENSNSENENSDLENNTNNEPNIQNYSTQIIINEILPNPEGSDNEAEFVELKNLSDEEIDLNAWQIADSGKTYTLDEEDFSSTIISGGGFFLLERTITGIALNNSGGETVELKNPEEIIISFITYGSASEGKSYSRTAAGAWQWTLSGSPGEENIFTEENLVPEAVIEAPSEAEVYEEITFLGSNSTDSNGDNLLYFWDFGDGQGNDQADALHIYNKAGSYNVNLLVIDSTGETSIAEWEIDIWDSPEQSSSENSTQDAGSTDEDKIVEEEKENNNESASDSIGDEDGEIIITEVMPNPLGSDSEEWLEIFNEGETRVDMTGWQIDDEEGGSKPYTLPATTIEAGEYLVFIKNKTGLTFNNSSDSVRLFNPGGELIFETRYNDCEENSSWARDENGNWSWTFSPTPEDANIITLVLGYEEEFDEDIKISSSLETDALDYIPEINLSEIREQEMGTLVKVNGVIAAEPGVLGSQIFYLAGSGIQVYMYKKDFPELTLGDYVEITGTLSETNGEAKIKLNQREDIVVLDYEGEPESKTVTIAEIGEDLEGWLVTVLGEVVETKSNEFYLDDNTGELHVYLKSSTGIKKPDFKTGALIRVTGLVSQTKSDYRLLPRYPEDIVQVEISNDLEIINEEIQIENLTDQNDPLYSKIFAVEDKKGKIIRILIIAAIILVIVLGGVVIKYKLGNKKLK